MWKRLDVDKNQQYQVALCQEPDGTRRYALAPVGNNSLPEHCVLLTDVVPYDLLWWGNVVEISKTIKLTSGHSFSTDAHSIWFTEAEMDALIEDVPWEETPWLNGLPPSNLAPR